MKVPPWCKPAFWGIRHRCGRDHDRRLCLVGMGPGSTAEQMAKARADEAVTGILVPICVERFIGAKPMRRPSSSHSRTPRPGSKVN